jgi:hypothetical protein
MTSRTLCVIDDILSIFSGQDPTLNRFTRLRQTFRRIDRTTITVQWDVDVNTPTGFEWEYRAQPATKKSG